MVNCSTSAAPAVRKSWYFPKCLLEQSKKKKRTLIQLALQFCKLKLKYFVQRPSSRGLNYRQKHLVLTEKNKGICYKNASGKETGFGQNSPDFDSRDKKNWLFTLFII